MDHDLTSERFNGLKMESPYTSPKDIDIELGTARVNRILRLIAALSFGYLAVTLSIAEFIPLFAKIVTVSWNAIGAIAILRRGAKFCLGVA